VIGGPIVRFLSFTSRRQVTGRDIAFLAPNTNIARKPLKAVRAARRCARRRGMRATPFHHPLSETPQQLH